MTTYFMASFKNNNWVPYFMFHTARLMTIVVCFDVLVMLQLIVFLSIQYCPFASDQILFQVCKIILGHTH